MAAIGGIATAGAGVSIATIASLTSVVATAIGTATQKPPAAQGSVAQSIIQSNAPQPYVVGEGYVGGVLRHDVGYGGKIDDVMNPYRFQVYVYSGGGPVQSISPRVDFETVGSYYNTFLYTSTQLGTTPQASALSPQWPNAPGWGPAYKLSGQAAIGWSARFDKKGKRFGSGLPVMGAYGQWVKVYDPRLDSTFPGGSGSCRLGVESTYVWSENPALHAGTYAFGRYQNGKQVFGIGMPREGVDWQTVAAWANVCQINNWRIFGRIFEPGDRWANLKDICMAGGAQPVFSGGVISFRFSAPVVALDTITEEDNAGEDDQVTAQQSYRDRLNTLIPRYTSAAHNWEPVAAAPVQVPTFLAEDGEERVEEWPFNLVKDVNQAAQLAMYHLWDSRELQPIVLHCKPRLRAYRPGDCLHIDRPDLGLDTDAIVLAREIDPATMTVKLTLRGETPAKHAYALGQTGTPPDTPALGQTGPEADDTVADNAIPPGFLTQLISTSYTTDADPPDGLLQAAEIGGVMTLHVEDHTRTYSDLPEPIAVLGGDFTHEDDGVTPLTASTLYHVYYDDPNRAGGVVAMKLTRHPQKAATSGENPVRHYVGSLTTPTPGGSSEGGGATPPGWSPGGWSPPMPDT